MSAYLAIVDRTPERISERRELRPGQLVRLRGRRGTFEFRYRRTERSGRTAYTFYGGGARPDDLGRNQFVTVGRDAIARFIRGAR